MQTKLFSFLVHSPHFPLPSFFSNCYFDTGSSSLCFQMFTYRSPFKARLRCHLCESHFPGASPFSELPHTLLMEGPASLSLLTPLLRLRSCICQSNSHRIFKLLTKLRATFFIWRNYGIFSYDAEPSSAHILGTFWVHLVILSGYIDINFRF